jgi:hypothetical protein
MRLGHAVRFFCIMAGIPQRTVTQALAEPLPPPHALATFPERMLAETMPLSVEDRGRFPLPGR